MKTHLTILLSIIVMNLQAQNLKGSNWTGRKVSNAYIISVADKSSIIDALTDFVVLVEAFKEPGCLLFSLSIKKDAPNTVVFFEIFKDEAALASHKEQQHTKDFGKQLEGKYEDNKVTFLNTVSTLHK